MNKASGGDGIPVELLPILKDDAVKVLHAICQQIWNTIISPSLTIYPAPHTAHILKHAEMKLQQIFLVRVSYSLSLGLTLGAYKRIVPGGRQLMRSFFRNP